MAVEPDGHVAGFGALSAYRERAGYATTVEDSVYVAEASRGKGVGRVLLEHLVELARHHGFHAIMAKIVGGHEVSIGLHAAVASRWSEPNEVGRKFGRWLDVVLMEQLL
ncbi:MAG: N-acetyltransferase family protein [Microthrixaceae bacterium]